MGLFKSICVLWKAVWNDDQRQQLEEDGMRRELEKFNLGWLFEDELVYLEFRNIIRNEKIVGRIFKDGTILFWDIGRFDGKLAQFIIKTLKDKPDTIWRD